MHTVQCKTALRINAVNTNFIKVDITKFWEFQNWKTSDIYIWKFENLILVNLGKGMTGGSNGSLVGMSKDSGLP